MKVPSDYRCLYKWILVMESRIRLLRDRHDRYLLETDVGTVVRIGGHDVRVPR
jgi:hypothetical protein